MAITGRLGDFDLAGVLQMLQQQGNSGHLQLEFQEQLGWLRISRGSVTQARVGELDISGILLRYLQAKGLDTTTWAHADARRGLEVLREEALRRGSLKEDECDRVIRQGLIDLGCRLFAWEKAQFRFTPGEEPTGSVQLGIDELTLEAMQRQDESPALEAEFPARQVLARTMEIDVLHFPPGDVPDLAPDRHVFMLLDGILTVEELEERTWLSPIRLRQSLQRLQQRDWIEEVEAASTHDAMQERDIQSSVLLQAGVCVTLAAAILLAAVLLLGDRPLLGLVDICSANWKSRLDRRQEPKRLLERVRSSQTPATAVAPESY